VAEMANAAVLKTVSLWIVGSNPTLCARIFIKR
jgi:hypothetical protein